MVHESGNENSVVKTKKPHKCGLFCLGPLTFHPQAMGEKVRLSRGCRLAERMDGTFKNGLVFSSRSVKLQEKIRLRVEKDSFNWHGAMRIGFTNVPPEARSLPLPLMAIPNLTDTQGHWAFPLPDSYCQVGSELEFWVSTKGDICISSKHTKEHKLLTGVDVNQPLWAMIDVYGQTCSISLLGSEKRQCLRTRRSCPAPECITSSDNCNNSTPDFSILDGNSDECISCLDMNVSAGVKVCVVCMDKQARVTLPCGHQCLCNLCAGRVLQQFGNCPLCRHNIRAPSVVGRRVSVGPL
ncbi:E3 ubiquitin-protein ligase NEURL3 [Sebastes fasciatus]|uniref:E3 ubiquitin-protein ligase NEURL3 n=1 Tax=Sebastes fasciatus TaxID=394691 RepID=UPI003D9DBDFA